MKKKSTTDSTRKPNKAPAWAYNTSKLKLGKYSINKQNQNTGRSILLAALYDGDFDLALDLINNGANVNLADDRGETPLMLACKNDNNLYLVKLLIKKGAALDSEDSKGRDAFWVAKNYNCKAILKLLCNHSATDKLTPMLSNAKIASTQEKKDLNLS